MLVCILFCSKSDLQQSCIVIQAKKIQCITLACVRDDAEIEIPTTSWYISHYHLVCQIHMHGIRRILIWCLCLYFTQGCLETEFEGEYLEMTFTDCSGDQSLKLFKQASLHNEREYFAGKSYETDENIYLYYQSYYGIWGFSENLGGDALSLNDIRNQSPSIQVPRYDWVSYCNGIRVAGNMQYTRSNCQRCGSNKFTSPGSNICQCRAGQYPGSVGTCENCPTDTYKDSPSNALCTPCPENSISAAGSITSTACQCKNGFSGVSGSVCSMCSSGKYSVAT